mgnify:CR=1 FL=1
MPPRSRVRPQRPSESRESSKPRRAAKERRRGIGHTRQTTGNIRRDSSRRQGGESRRDTPRRDQTPQAGASRRRRRTATGYSVDSQRSLSRWLRLLSMGLPTLALTLLGARVSALIRRNDLFRQNDLLTRIAPRTSGSSLSEPTTVVDFVGVRTTAAAIHDWSLVAAAFVVLLGGWATVVVAVRIVARLLGGCLLARR